MSKEVRVFNLKLSTRSMNESIGWIKSRIKTKKGGLVFCCTLNEARMYNENFLIEKIIDEADLRTSDGMPLVWGLRLKTGTGERVYGPDLMINIFNSDKAKKLKHFFLGSTVKNLKNIQNRLVKEYRYKPKSIEFYSPEFKQKFNAHDYQSIEKVVKKFKPDIVWVGMGAEKQLIIANKLSKTIKETVWITVGAAFDYLAGTKKQCPILIRSIGFEWLYRWILEPKRLTKRYFKILQFLYSRVDLK